MTRVVVADDDEDLRRLLVRRLGRRGWEVTPAADGAEALQLVRDDPPAAVILDRSMPVMTGIEALEALRADPATAAVPVVLLSAEDETEADAGAAAQADARLPKPFELDVLDALLRRLTGG